MKSEESFYYQATIAYRDDFSIHIDLYDRSEAQEQPLRREISALFKEGYSRRVIIPDRGGAVGPDQTERGSPFSLMMPKIALWLTNHVYLDFYLTKGSLALYEFRGWETIDDHRCAVVGFYQAQPGTGLRYAEERFWIDLERGGLPIKLEKLVEGNVAARVIDVKLSQVETEDGKPVWFPVSGRLLSYGKGLFQYSPEPMAEQSFEVLQGTLAINQGLKDARFALDWGLSPNDRTVLKTPRRMIRKDRSESPEARLARAEVEADSQPLEASAPSREGWLAYNAIAIGALVLGIGAIIAAGRLRNRS